MAYSGSPRDKYRNHRFSAHARGIEFHLSFDEWMRTWLESGHFHERGPRKGQYVMARKGDKGPYAVGNVEIITSDVNNRTKIPPKGHTLSPEHKANMDVLIFNTR